MFSRPPFHPQGRTGIASLAKSQTGVEPIGSVELIHVQANAPAFRRRCLLDRREQDGPKPPPTPFRQQADIDNPQIGVPLGLRRPKLHPTDGLILRRDDEPLPAQNIVSIEMAALKIELAIQKNGCRKGIEPRRRYFLRPRTAVKIAQEG